jgi:hypothetical protein
MRKKGRCSLTIMGKPCIYCPPQLAIKITMEVSY